MIIISVNSRIYYENGTWESKYSYVDSVDSVEDNRNLDFFLIWEQNNRNNHSFGGSSDDRASDSIVIVKQNPHKITVNPSSMNSSPHSSRYYDFSKLKTNLIIKYIDVSIKTVTK